VPGHRNPGPALILSMLVLEVRPRVTFADHTARDWGSFVDELCRAVAHYLQARIPRPG
jgi:hypothetical protein